jgi:methylated-DNA-[protein]-cysteine S-methyltransferase
MYTYCYVDSPLGPLLLAARNQAIEFLFFPGNKGQQPESNWRLNPSAFTEARKQLDQYFAGERRNFSVPLAPHGTPFQQRVWQALVTIPYGETTSYSDIAVKIGHPKACRAVGMANRCNPIPIIIPCHRVIGKDGSLTGFGGGLAVKEQLLALERSTSLR